MMRAVVLRRAGGPEQLVCEQVTTPTPGAGEALVRVHAAALTRDELEWLVDRLPAIPMSCPASWLPSGPASMAWRSVTRCTR
jgi:NADPH:quinone reductase-like Zn-dependent oxidoreductase